MNADKQLKDILHMAVNNAVSRMTLLKNPSDRRCVFNEYKEWLGESIDNEVLEFLIAHNEGNYFCTNDQLKEIEDNNQIAINYCDENGKIEDQYNPNGSIKNIAGIFNKAKNVLGMMPHPERMIDQSLSGEDGSIFFKNLINNLK